ncbi:MAG: hypothetical protein H7263_06625, partial [Candidatus Sericytochromatia bacterium]|nr:hypothetical protein [Candidatus Sericytochromatia bacterium]
PKGDHLDNKETVAKIKLGRAWANKAGDRYKYFMVFDKNKREGSYTLGEVIELISKI